MYVSSNSFRVRPFSVSTPQVPVPWSLSPGLFLSSVSISSDWYFLPAFLLCPSTFLSPSALPSRSVSVFSLNVGNVPISCISNQNFKTGSPRTKTGSLIHCVVSPFPISRRCLRTCLFYFCSFIGGRSEFHLFPDFGKKVKVFFIFSQIS